MAVPGLCHSRLERGQAVHAIRHGTSFAGDALGEDCATGFIVGGAWDQVKSPDINLTLQQRNDELHDMVATTASTFLGLTVGCARCHNHKFDPISQADYYSMQAIFAGVQHGDRAIKTPDYEEREKEAARLEIFLAGLDNDLDRFEPLAKPEGTEAARAPVNPRRNVERFAPVEVKYVRFTILATSGAEPCIDELEIFSAGESPRNVALASEGAKASASGTYHNSYLHKLEHINDGRYGNSRSWISSENGKGWIQIELPQTTVISKIVWGRDREEKFSDRLATQYVIEAALEPGKWRVIAGSADREPYVPGTKTRLDFFTNMLARDAANRASPIAPEGAAGAARQPYPPRAGRLALRGAPPASQRAEEIARDAPELLSPGEVAELNSLLARAGEAREKLERWKADQKIYGGTFSEPEASYLLYRGDPLQKREQVTPAALASFGSKTHLQTNSPEQERRLALGQWIIDPQNPMTARVMVNRIWQHHFGEGLVGTPSDFGLNGARPSHPELLDRLAVEFQRRGWSIKAMHRLIVLSSTYRQGSAPNPPGLRADGSDRLLWRFNPQRLEAEPLRDEILSVSGKLNLRMGGPGFRSLFRSERELCARL